jgi:processive 1,2-diacylglycerol beta-glucosyltransferase
MDALEEESDADRDYYIDGPTIDVLVGAGAREGLADLLRRAIGSREGVEVRWSRA